MADAKKKLKVVEELRALDEKALVTKIADLRKETVEQHQAHAAGELPSNSVIAKTRKEIAKALTVLREKQATQASKEQEK